MELELPPIGSRLGEWTLGAAIGRGGYAAVFEAQHCSTGQLAALKIICPEQGEQSEELTLRFLREVDLVKRLDHPHLVRLYDYGQSPNGLLWMALELLGGLDLAAVLRQEVQLTVARALHIILQILDGLAYAHRFDIVHRDLKPANIMLCSIGGHRDHVKILDFGVAKALGGGDNPDIQNLTERIGGALGTPRYAAPEVLRGRVAGPTADVYAAGLVLFEMLTGRPAVPGKTVFEILQRQLSEALELPPWLQGSPLGDAISKATAKEPSARFDSSCAFREALAELVPQPSAPQPGHCDQTGRVGAHRLGPGSPTPAVPLGIDTGALDSAVANFLAEIEAAAEAAEHSSDAAAVPLDPPDMAAPERDQPPPLPKVRTATHFDDPTPPPGALVVELESSAAESPPTEINDPAASSRPSRRLVWLLGAITVASFLSAGLLLWWFLGR